MSESATIIDASAPTTARSRRRLSLSGGILTGLLLGIACGVVLGEYASPMQIIGDAYVALLKMCVLPFIAVSLLSSVAKLTLRQGRRLLLEGGVVLIALWMIGLLTVWVFAQALPDWKAGSFYSSSATSPSDIDLLDLFIPSNIFAALSNDAIPAVVFFILAIGVALATLPDKEILTRQLDLLTKVLTKVNHFIVRLTPLGVFGIAAHAAGTLSWAEAGRLQAYVLIYAGATLLVTFVLLPGLICALTPIRYAEVISISKDAMITAFATGKLIVVLPLLIVRTEEFFRSKADEQQEWDQARPAVDSLYPLAYSLPHMGKVITIIFVPFAAWFLGNAMTTAEYPRFLAAGLVSSFSGPILSTPFLLDIMHLPHDMFQLFLLSGVFCGRLADVMGVMHLIAFTLITTSAFSGHLRWSLRPLLKYIAVSLTLGALVLIGTRQALAWSLQFVAARDEVIAGMQLLDAPVEAVVLSETSPNPVPLLPGQSLLDRVRQRGVLRVGYDADKLPFAYFNIQGDLVGYDINLAHTLARDLRVSLEFVPFNRERLKYQLEADHFDIVMSGLVGTLERAESMLHTRPYLDLTLAFVVEDYRVRSFNSLASLANRPGLRIGFVDLSRGLVDRLQNELPQAEFIELKSNGQYFQGAYQDIDALLIGAENGSAFTLFFPEFEVVVPDDINISLPLFYAVGGRDVEMRDFLEHWVDMRKKDGSMDKQYDHWILGKNQGPRKRRWSVIRDVLGWAP